ncbi:phosphomannomutase/phosphoglucomutase [bacterium]|nr:phosphomannomutase/phosphoglucomutase [bacterium]
MNSHIFRQYDIRGVVEEDLTPDVVELIGRGFGSWVRDEGGSSLALGRDGRLTGPQLRDAFVKGARSAGIDVIDVGMVPTPVLYFALYHLKPDAAVQITGSHNPPEFNGFKMMMGKNTVFGDMIQDLYKRIEAENFTDGEGGYKEVHVVSDYINYITSNITLKRPVNLALDSGNGIAGAVAPDLFRALGCKPVELFSEVDGLFPNHHPDPTVEENLVDLHKAVTEQKLECGVAFDGDGDRIGVIDDMGTVLWGDRLLALFSRYVLKDFPGATVIGEVKCSKALYDDVAKHGGNPLMWKTGHSFLKAKLRETDAKIAGEMSGHMFFNDRYFGYDDAMYAAVRLAEIIADEGRPLSELLADLPVLPVTPEMRVDCPDEIKFDVVEEVAKYFKSRYDVVDIDGVRVNFDKGWGLVRASNTQPVLVMRFEAEEESLLNEYRNEVENVVADVRSRLG